MSLGIGIACVTSVGPRMKWAVERDCLVQSLLRRISTPRDSLSWAPGVGIDVRDYLNHGTTPQARFSLASDVQNEIEKDERVQEANCSAEFVGETMMLTIAIDPSDADSFTLVVAVTALTIELLEVT